MKPNNEWELFRTFTDIGSAQVVCAWLLSEEVPAKVDTVSLESALAVQYHLYVRSDLAHRARWVVAQPPPTDAELEFLATGKLPGGQDN